MKYEKTIRPPVDAKNPNFYLDKTEFNLALKEHKDNCIKAEEAGLPIPPVSNYIGECFMMIANGLAMKHNFRNYSFIDDCKADAIATCLRYVRSYDPDRRNADTGLATSALSYFTQCCHYAFLDRIKKEHKQMKVKRALVYSADIDTFTTQDEDAGEFQMNLTEFLAGLGKEEVEEIVEKKVRAQKPGGLEGFM